MVCYQRITNETTNSIIVFCKCAYQIRINKTIITSVKDKVKILNVEINNISKEDLLKNLFEGVLITPNVDHLVNLQKDKEFYEVYQNADWVVCDSKILYFISKLLKNSIKEAIPGSGFFPAFYHYHKDNKDMKIFLLGAAEGVAEKAKNNINNEVGWEMVIGAHSPSYGFENNEEECEQIVNLINSTCANVLLVGVGAPKQEKWIYKYKNRFDKVKLFMALGATIDFEAKHIPRAPQHVQKSGLEWLYRLYREPQRLWRRYLVEDIKFFYYFALQLIGRYKNPFGED